MSGQGRDSITIELAGNRNVSFELLEDESDSQFSLVCTYEGQAKQVAVSANFSDVRMVHFLVGMASIDLVSPNLGSRLAVDGVHPVDSAIRKLLERASGVSLVSGRDDLADESVDAFIGCDLGALILSLPSIRRGGDVVLTCIPEQDDRLDIYSSLHRKGLHFRSLDLGRDLLENLPSLLDRFARLLEVDSNLANGLNKG
jgi:hypothetical protein